MDAEQQVIWHFVSRHLEPLMEEHIAQTREAHGEDWVRHIDPWKLVLPAVEKTASVVRSLDAMDADVRAEVTQAIVGRNARIAEMLRPSIEDALAGRVVPGEQVILMLRDRIANRT